MRKTINTEYFIISYEINPHLCPQCLKRKNCKLKDTNVVKCVSYEKDKYITI